MLAPKIRFKAGEGKDFPDWEGTTIGQEGSFYYGKSAPKSSISSEAITPCVRYGELYTTHSIVVKNIKSFTNTDPSQLVFSKGGEVLVPRVGEEPLDFCKCCYLPQKGVAIGEMISVYNTEQNPLFISYLFNSQMKYEFARKVEGGNVSNLYYTQLLNIHFNLPCKEEQEKIAEFLSILDEKISASESKVEKLETLKKGLTQKIFSQEIRFKDTEGKEFPAWEERQLSDICEYAKDVVEGGNHVCNENLLSHFSGIEKLDESGEIKGTGFQCGDVLIGNIRPYLEKTWFATCSGVASSDVLVLRPKKILADFLYQFIARPEFFIYIMSGAKGSKMPRGDKDHILKAPISLPSKNEQKKIASFLSSVDEKICLAKDEVEVLKRLKKGLMQQMFV